MLHREDFVERLTKKGYTKKDARIIINDVFRTIEEALIEGESIMFRGFGTFEVRNRIAREIASPKTGERIMINPYKTAHFTPGKLLMRELKESRIIEKR